MTDQLKLYLVTRSDLPPGLQVAQACHAALAFATRNPDMVTHWERWSNNLVVLAVPGEDDLADLNAAVNSKLMGEFEVVEFHEPDLDHQLTAIAIEPHPKAKAMLREYDLALAGAVAGSA